MHIHILGICGTFMGGVAVLAQQSGHKVTGCDANVYPPMSTQLREQGIELIEGFDPAQIDVKPDIFVIGNVVTRGNPLMEEILNRGLPFISGPQWLAENVLHGKWVLAVAGTHGKTTTSSMLAWILEYAGLKPGFLIGGVPQNFGVSARLAPRIPPRGTEPPQDALEKTQPGSLPSPPPLKQGATTQSRRDLDGAPQREKDSLATTETRGDFFVIEADEYDTAFFDKRSKFVHYRAQTAIINNVEFDHADIFPDLAAIEQQFHHFVRIIPSRGLVVANGLEEAVGRILKKGCWTPVEFLGREPGWSAMPRPDESIAIALDGVEQGVLRWELLGEHNRMNALAAIAAARHAGVPVATGIAALGEFQNVKRRMEVRGVIGGVTVYDDFAHHPTAIRHTLEGLRKKVGAARVLAVLEPRSNTMKMGVWRDDLGQSLAAADQVFGYTGNLGWDVHSALAPLGNKLSLHDDLAHLVGSIVAAARAGDHVLIMSNGGFGGIHEKLLKALQSTAAPSAQRAC